MSFKMGILCTFVFTYDVVFRGSRKSAEKEVDFSFCFLRSCTLHIYLRLTVQFHCSALTKALDLLPDNRVLRGTVLFEKRACQDCDRLMEHWVDI